MQSKNSVDVSIQGKKTWSNPKLTVKSNRNTQGGTVPTLSETGHMTGSGRGKTTAS